MERAILIFNLHNHKTNKSVTLWKDQTPKAKDKGNKIPLLENPLHIAQRKIIIQVLKSHLKRKVNKFLMKNKKVLCRYRINKKMNLLLRNNLKTLIKIHQIVQKNKTLKMNKVVKVLTNKCKNSSCRTNPLIAHLDLKIV